MIDIRLKIAHNDILKIRNLYLSGESVISISKKMSIHPSTVCDYLEREGIKRRLPKEAGILASRKGRNPIKHKIPKSSKYMTKEKAYIIGVICGDGYLHKTKRDSYQIALQSVDIDFVLRFFNCMKYVYGITPSVSKIKPYNNNWQDRFQARVCSKEAFNDILRYGVFGKSEWTIPQIIFDSPNEIRYWFLRGFFDSEGSVDKSRKVIICSINGKGIKQIKHLLLSINIQSNTRFVRSVKENRKDIHILQITGRNNIEKYSQRIGFSINRKQQNLEDLIGNYKKRLTPHKEVVKYRTTILELRNSGLSYKKIAKELNLGVSTVWNYINKYE